MRGSSILPFGPVLQFIPDQHRFNELELHCWPPYPADGWLYEDDGSSRDYLQGASAQTIFHAEQMGDRLLVQIGAGRGQFEGQPIERRLSLILQRSQAPVKVWVNGGLYQNWVYDPLLLSLRIDLLCPVARPTQLEIVYPS